MKAITYEGLVTRLGFYASDAHLVANMMSILLECHSSAYIQLTNPTNLSRMFLRTYTN